MDETNLTSAAYWLYDAGYRNDPHSRRILRERYKDGEGYSKEECEYICSVFDRIEETR